MHCLEVIIARNLKQVAREYQEAFAAREYARCRRIAATLSTEEAFAVMNELATITNQQGGN